MAGSGKIRVEVESEEGCSERPASVRVFENNKLIVEVTATTELKPGADSNLYPCVTLTKREIE